MTDRTHRLAILSDEEINDLYRRPTFTDDERLLYFDLSDAEHAVVATRRETNGVYLVLLLGYFKAKRQFFEIDPDVAHEDIDHVLERHFPALVRKSTRRKTLQPLSPNLRIELQKLVLQLLNFRPWNKSERDALAERIQHIATRSTQPRYLLREALQYVERERLPTPAYSTLQDIIGNVVANERTRLTDLLEKTLTKSLRAEFDALLQAGESMYRISVLKHEPKDFSYKALKEEVERRQRLKPLHAFAQRFLSAAGLSQESSKYFASLVTYYTAYKLQRMAPSVTRLYLLCFAYYRYRQINDHLIEAFLVRVKEYSDDAREKAEEAMRLAMTEASNSLGNL